MSDITPDPIMRIALGFMEAKHLFVASEIGCSRSWRAAPWRSTRLPRRPASRARCASVPMRWQASGSWSERTADTAIVPQQPPFSPARTALICGRCCASLTR